MGSLAARPDTMHVTPEFHLFCLALRRPLAQQAIAASDDAETHFLIVREFILERFLAVVEGGHAVPSSICRAR